MMKVAQMAFSQQPAQKEILLENPAFKEVPVLFRSLSPEIPSTSYATFGLYRYPAKFIPQVIAYALKTYGVSGMRIMDPFAGYGTTGIVSRIYGNPYELWDLNPLLKFFHSAAVMSPQEEEKIDLKKAVENSKPYVPDWGSLNYWHPEECLDLLSKAWGYFHQLKDQRLKNLLLIPLLKTTHYFSFNDEKRLKLSRSPMADKRIETLLEKDWKNIFYKMIWNGYLSILLKLKEYQSLNPQPVDCVIQSAVDGLAASPEKESDILITSPPYLQAQEYIRSTKMDLFWMGYSEEFIKDLGKKEIPYRDVPVVQIHSPTYDECLNGIDEAHLQKMFKRYFYGVFGILNSLQEKIRKYLLLFVGPANVRGNAIPMSQIFREHFTSLGWKHEITLVDTIVSRSMFLYKTNPATGISDNRMKTEHLIVLSRERASLLGRLKN
jgi:hypothetical protein